MGSMSWSDDTRCLYCDGRMPLYRKITQGQFCSSGHRKAYWQDQEKLAVERLSQTHSSLQAFRLAQPPESALAVPAAILQAPPRESTDPSFGNLLLESVTPSAGLSPKLVAADPLEYEVFAQPQRPSLTPAVIATRPLPLGNLISGWADFSACRWTGQLALWDSAPVAWTVAPRTPTSAWVIGETLTVGNQVGIPVNVIGSPNRIASSGGPLDSTLEPVTHMTLGIPPSQSEVLLQLLDEQAPRPERLFSLACVSPREGGALLRRTEDAASIATPALISRGESMLQFTLAAPVPSAPAMLGLPLQSAGVESSYRTHRTTSTGVPPGSACPLIRVGFSARSKFAVGVEPALVSRLA